MGKHALPRTPSRARRAAVVSTGTLLLCLCGAAPALADIGPVPVPDPVEDVVDQASDTLGIPNPIDTTEEATGTAKPTKDGDTRKHKHHKAGTDTDTTTSKLTTTDSKTTRTHNRFRPGHFEVRELPGPAPTYTYTGSSMTTATKAFDAVRPPVTAGAVGGSDVMAAGSSPTLIRPSASILDGTGGEDGPRVLIIGLAAMVLGGLSAGHIKVAQDRLAGLISS